MCAESKMAVLLVNMWFNIEVRTSDTYREVLAGGVCSRVGVSSRGVRWNCVWTTHTGPRWQRYSAGDCRFGMWSGARADATRPHSPKLHSNLPHMSRSRVTPAPDLVPARPG